MELFRITKAKYLENYSGRGKSFLEGARWNKAGQPVLYFAQSPSVAQLEMSHYLPSPQLVPKSYRLGIYSIDGASVTVFDRSKLPQDWDDFPYPQSTQEIGGKWLESNSGSIFLVPSTAVTGGRENIAVVNPLHPEISKIRLIGTENKIYSDRTFIGI